MSKNKMKKFIKSTGWQLFSKIYTMLLSLVVGALTARYLGPSNYGLIGYGSSLVALFINVSSLGMNDVVQKELIDTPENRGEILGTALCMRILASLLCMLAIDILVRVVEPGHDLLRTVTILQSFALLIQTGEVLGYWFHVRLEFKYISIGTMIASTVVCIWRVCLLVSNASLEYFAASSCLQYLASSSMLVFFFIRKYPTKLVANITTARKILKSSYHFILSGLAISLYTQMDKIMLGNILSEEMVGYYTAASTIASIWEFVPIAIINSAMVIVLESKKENEERYKKTLSLLLCGISCMGIAVALIFTVFGKIAILILYGRTYLPAFKALIILSWSSCSALIGCARGSTWVLAENLNKYSKHYVIISSVANFALNLILIPRWGIEGAAAATLVSQIMTTFISPMFFKETRSFASVYIDSWCITAKEIKEIIISRKGS